MNWFSNLSTRAKLLASFGLVIALLAVVIATFYTSIVTIQQTQKQLYDRDVANAVALPQLRAEQNGIHADSLAMILTPNRAERAVWEQDIKERATRSVALLDDLLERNRADAQSLAQIQELTAVRAAFAKTRNTEVIPLINAGKMAEARALTLGIQIDRYEKMRDITQILEAAAAKDMETAMRRSNAKVRQAIEISLGSGAGAVLLAVLLALFLNHIIANPLKDITGAAEQIAGGDLGVNISADHRRDEVGTLAVAFSRMTKSLQGMAGVAEQMARGDLRVQVKPQSNKDLLGTAFASMTVSMQKIISDIAEAVNVLSSSASEISASTTQLAASATETATAVTETTATVEEIRQTAQVANEKAKYVSESAQNVARISQDGRKSTEETSRGMQRIREQMDSIGESMMRLSEQSQAIGEIIATVDDLAQQSNLLAVNAAIEAAKAGEAGKGFAVVAQEVKSLADQSKQATTQVRTILSDIQKATGAAVMATEQGSKAVEIGVQQSAQAGESIQSLADNVSTSAQSAMQIAASSQQQLVGMDQMTLAMESIKQASLQNVDGARGLEEASRNLNELGHRLKELVSHYQV